MYPEDLRGCAGLNDNIVSDVKSDWNGVDELVDAGLYFWLRWR